MHTETRITMGHHSPVEWCEVSTATWMRGSVTMRMVDQEAKSGTAG